MAYIPESSRAVVIACLLLACSNPAPVLEPLPSMETEELGSILAQQLAMRFFTHSSARAPGEFRWDSDGPRFGTRGANSVRGPGLLSLDMGLCRKVRISERPDLQIRVEALNASNTVHFERPNSLSVTSGTCMIRNRIRNTGREGIDERTFRFGLRLGW